MLSNTPAVLVLSGYVFGGGRQAGGPFNSSPSHLLTDRFQSENEGLRSIPHLKPSGNLEETIELQDAIDSLYDIAVVQEKATSTLRLRKLAEFCVQELHLRGLVGVETEVTIDGGGREKNWDVVWQHHGKPRLAISLKSLLKNLSGTVPNRIDDLMGEMTNVQMYSPEIVAGYIMLFDVAKDTDDGTWCGLFRERLNRLSGRRGPAWSFGMVEESLMVEIDFSERARVLKGESDVSGFFDRLVAEVRVRNPDLIAAE